MLEELQALQDIVVRLARANTPYMLTGSMAMSFYARPRMTRDIDIVIVLPTANVDSLVSVLKDTYYVDLDVVRRATREPPHMFNVIHEQLIVKVDLILRADTEYGRVAFGRRRAFELNGVSIFVIAPEDLILAKLTWARESHSEVQLRDVRALFQGDDRDIGYISHWVQKLDLQSVWELVQT